MKKILTILALFIGISSFAQVPDYFEGNPQWRMYLSYYANMPCFEMHNYVRYLDGDSIVDGITYKKMYTKNHIYYEYQQGDPPPYCTGTSYWEGFTLLIRQDNKKIFVRDYQEEMLLYDFDLQVGDTLPFSYNLFIENVIVTAIDSILVGSSYRKVFELDEFPWGNDLIEGIGFTNSFIDPVFEYDINIRSLHCFVQYDTSYYPYYGVPCDLAVSIDETEKELHVEFYPNPVTDQLFIKLATPIKITKISSVTADGRNFTLPFIQADPQKLIVDFAGKPAGMHLIHLFAGKQTVAIIKMMKR